MGLKNNVSNMVSAYCQCHYVIKLSTIRKEAADVLNRKVTTNHICCHAATKAAALDTYIYVTSYTYFPSEQKVTLIC